MPNPKKKTGRPKKRVDRANLGPPGQPTKYNKSMVETARLSSQMGYTAEDTAKRLGISKDSFYTYCKLYPDFSDAFYNGRRQLQEKAGRALTQKLEGFHYKETVSSAGKETVHKKFCQPDTQLILHMAKTMPAFQMSESESAAGNKIDQLMDAIKKDAIEHAN